MGATLVAYLLLLLGIGKWAQARTNTEGDFFLGGRRVGPWIAAVGASATSSSAWTLLGVSGLAYGSGLQAVWLFPACVGGFALNWFVIAPALQRYGHRTGAMTLIEVLAGPPAGRIRRAVVVLASLIVLVSLGAYVAAQFQAAGKLFHDIFAVPAWQAVVVGGAVILAYTWLGGFWAVSVTDTVQGLMMAATAVVLPIVAVHTVGGFGALFDSVLEVDVHEFANPLGASTNLVVLGVVLGYLGIGVGYPGQPHVAKFFLALEQEPDSVKRARRVALTWACLVYAGMILLGWSGRVLIDTLGDNEVVFVRVVRDLLPAALGGVMIAAVLSAIMSTADSQLLVASSTVTHDLGVAGTTKSNVLWRSRIVVFVLTAAAVIAALTGSESIFERVLFAWAAMGAAFGPLLIVKIILRRRVPAARALGSMAVGFGWSVLAYFCHADWFPEAPWSRWGLVHRGVVPFLAAFLVAWLGTEPEETGDPEVLQAFD